MTGRGTRGGARRRWTRAAAVALVAGSLASATAACGGERKPVRLSGGTFEKELPRDEARGQQLTERALALMRATHSMRINVAQTKGSAAGGTARRQEVTLHVDRESNCTGTVQQGIVRGEMIMVKGRATYVRFQDSSLDALSSLARARGPETSAQMERRVGMLRGKYVKFPTGDGSSGRGVMPSAQCDLDEVLGNFDDVGGTTTIRAQDPTWRYGRQVIPLVEHQDGTDTTVYVAAEGKPYLVGMELEERGGDRMTMRISDYDEPVEAKAPPAAQTIDASELDGIGGGAGLFEV
ncbi:hypothetical protein [Streptomyces spectabilis]|uniref:Lipoprotein n=1 Tax=Streptomyces spectabilis TaxID=68270 RepID=A0A516RCD6_STRST|nr:hypothetical protein [Streptomyces spectabilis]QDQ13331.1 hypothetical protein FH965_24460 [Streptomyces spectabilis]